LGLLRSLSLVGSGFYYSFSNLWRATTGLGHAISQAIADAGINMDFVVAQVVGRKYSGIFGFESEADATKGAAEN
jgi:hypothetical protein